MTSTLPSVAPATAVAPPRTLGILSFVLGLLSLVFGLIFLVPIAAIVLGALALRSEPASKWFAITGIVIGSLQLLWLAISGVVLLAALPFFGILSAFGWN